MSIFSNAQQHDLMQTVGIRQDILDPVRQYILSHFGTTGLYAAYLIGIAIMALLLHRLIKFSFQIMFFVVIPSTITAFILDKFLPYDFFYLLPITAALFTMGLVLRTVAFAKD